MVAIADTVAANYHDIDVAYMVWTRWMNVIYLASAVVTILGGLVITARWFAKRLDRWANAVVDNSNAVRGLTVRVTRLEKVINDNT